MGLAEKVIVTCAISGVVANKQQCPGIPYTPGEYAAEARRIRDAGGSVIHIHARTPEGKPSVALEDYRAISEAITGEVPDIVVNFSTGFIGVPMQERVAHVVELRPELGALNMGSMNYGKYSSKRKDFVFKFVFSNSFDDIIYLLTRMKEAGVKPELECFDVGHVESFAPLVDLGLLTHPIQFSLIHGVLGGISPTARNLAYMASVLPPGSTWEVIGISREQWQLVASAIVLGGNVRVGLEDNFYLPDGRMASSNGELVAKAASLVRELGREVASPNEARALLSLPVPARAAG
ncbi:MAG: 3-keto-5-aminohexanoate cleavage protein [Actinomycetota bacterium]